MPGYAKTYRKRDYGRALTASRYEDPRGGRACALERNILRYRAIEATLYLFYDTEVRDFILQNLYPLSQRTPGGGFFQRSAEQRLHGVLYRALGDAREKNVLTEDDFQALCTIYEDHRLSAKNLKKGFAHAVKIGVFTAAEADELQDLLAYRNDIAHRIHEVMADVSRLSWNRDHLNFKPPTYKADALDRLRAYRKSLWCRAKGLATMLNMDGLIFEFAETVFEAELKRLDSRIARQIKRERARIQAINAELDLRHTELVDDLDPRFPANHRPSQSWGDDYIPATGHLTKRGVEICYRLFDMGKSPIAVAYAMGMTLRSAERRRKGWLTLGGPNRIRSEIKRYPIPARQQPSGDAAAA